MRLTFLADARCPMTPTGVILACLLVIDALS
ncbi:hypothetical protein PANA5342_4134 [Pantoea ananatis LMG 5342]|nr:hypothetical protein PANA5342_4134 [Pantoea ananatis LMG 5342]